MTKEFTAAELDAQADKDLAHMEATGWKTVEPANTDGDTGEATDTGTGTGTETGANAIKLSDDELQDLADQTAKEAATDRESKEAALRSIAEDTPDDAKDPLQFAAKVPDGYKDARSALLKEKADAFEKVMGGEMGADEYAVIESRVMDGLDELSTQRIRAETLLEANAQTSARTSQAVILAIMASSKGVVEYATDAKAQRQFDMALQQINADPDNTGKPFAHIAAEAHKVVLALRGVQAKPDAKGIPAARNVPNTPVTLAGLPNAGTSGEKSVAQVLSGLSGPDFDKAFDSLPMEQQQKYLQQA